MAGANERQGSARPKAEKTPARSQAPASAEANSPSTSSDVKVGASQKRSLIENPWIALLLLPIFTTLFGVLAALYLDNWRASREQKDRVVGLLQIAGQECEAINKTLAGVQIDQQPVFVPSLGIALLNIQQDAESLKVIPADDFRDLVQQLVGIQSTLSDYGRLANDYRLLAIQTPRGLPPPILPMPDGPPKPETPQEAAARYAKAMEDLETMRQTHLAHMRQTLQSYKDAVKSFCVVGARIHDQLAGGAP
ncbi:hypothetical protein [Mesorhizobium sp. M00.F.Ca.ET.217.01.1.1]|uniref:hypothetical protein n=1 Tax=Mesorhizobium sp. M00.F.Ca.ET.217.01.1.1 TaxID=2500529 RepID=UPI000FDC0DB8|nr:hypothetical protein [Mesorhizobium sp. M00.F.Ca.ET.217.01.1.1]TGQ13573.1 hypothetical protein EN860_030535 [Mesorhizobium sp. M00.F.Ca.ET.217.01.1.1]TGV85438.1 hypothetical protein EN801_029245 [Mesorhizobium sp. M00.F.Ca.ET.158.01.1.1]